MYALRSMLAQQSERFVWNTSTNTTRASVYVSATTLRKCLREFSP